MWFPSQQLRIALRTCQKCKLLGPALAFGSETLEAGPRNLGLTGPAGDSDARSRLTTSLVDPGTKSECASVCVGIVGKTREGGEEGWPEVGGALRRGKGIEAEAGSLATLPFAPHFLSHREAPGTPHTPCLRMKRCQESLQ